MKSISASIPDECYDQLIKECEKRNITRAEYLRELLSQHFKIEQPHPQRSLLSRLKERFGVKEEPEIKSTTHHKKPNMNPSDLWVFSKSTIPFKFKTMKFDKLYSHNLKPFSMDMHDVKLIKQILMKQDNQITVQQVRDLRKLFGVNPNNNKVTRLVCTVQRHYSEKEYKKFERLLKNAIFGLDKAEDKIIIGIDFDVFDIPKRVCLEIIATLNNNGRNPLQVYNVIRCYQKVGFSAFAVACICEHWDDPNLLKWLKTEKDYPVENNPSRRRNMLKSGGVF